MKQETIILKSVEDKKAEFINTIVHELTLRLGQEIYKPQNQILSQNYKDVESYRKAFEQKWVSLIVPADEMILDICKQFKVMLTFDKIAFSKQDKDVLIIDNLNLEDIAFRKFALAINNSFNHGISNFTNSSEFRQFTDISYLQSQSSPTSLLEQLDSKRFEQLRQKTKSLSTQRFSHSLSETIQVLPTYISNSFGTLYNILEIS